MSNDDAEMDKLLQLENMPNGDADTDIPPPLKSTLDDNAVMGTLLLLESTRDDDTERQTKTRRRTSHCSLNTQANRGARPRALLGTEPAKRSRQVKKKIQERKSTPALAHVPIDTEVQMRLADRTTIRNRPKKRERESSCNCLRTSCA